MELRQIKGCEDERLGVRCEAAQQSAVGTYGTLPSGFIKKFTTRRGFIYVMEVLSAVLSVVVTRSVLPPLIVLYIDNQAGRCAIEKGYGKTPW